MSRRALFEAWRGRYSDSPRVLSERLAVVAPAVKHYWITSGQSRFPSDVIQVPRHRLRHFAALATCDLLITNDIVTRHFVKGPRVTYLQAWHGSPIKVVGLDETAPRYRNASAHLRRMQRDVAKWDYLLSNSAVFTKVLRGAFGYSGRVLEVGYPRNDILTNDDGSQRDRARASLGIRADQTCVLYAPTWRDDAHDADGRLTQTPLLDWQRLDAGLPDSMVVLNRAHQHVTPDPTVRELRRVVDVSNHDDVAALILASDALVSDYSSIVHDYAITRRPIILYAPDLERYRDSVRALYFDYESWAPGPIASTTDELVDALRSLTEIGSTYSRTLDSFIETYCTFDDGRSSERVVSILAQEIGF